MARNVFILLLGVAMFLSSSAIMGHIINQPVTAMSAALAGLGILLFCGGAVAMSYSTFMLLSKT